MKRVLINHLLEPANKISGISNYLFYLLDSLLKNKQYQFVLLTCWDECELPSMLQGRGLEVVTKPYIESMPKNLINQIFILPRILKEKKIDLEFNPDPVGCIFGKVPLINVTHDLYFDVAPQNYKLHHRLWWKIFFPLTLKRAIYNICVSKNTARDLIYYYPDVSEKVRVVHESACLNGPKVELKRKDYGIFVANVSPNKGVEVLVKAMSILKSMKIDVDIYHVGRDSNGYFELYAKKLNTTTIPIKLGYLSNEDLIKRYCEAKFLAFPSSYEGFGLPILEAQKYGLPVIASNIPVLREVAGNGAIFFERDDADKLVDSIIEIIKNTEKFNSLSLAAINNSCQFSWAKAADKTIELFNLALDMECNNA
ncbi:glycosyltransferase family 4 protein [Shewanella gaetbuli]|uniref:Glycosyltransferase family 4 protein n=1 Tax=Shewanella gaetbuli TaxID=220752 RepID=A0A9X2CM16_9GAMM|nr:glycosyltransferase family 1 protein [Shewanella gaetbuli]MCL1143254.1 glycosyltransferase family 4 protein [Shewanella gaetbuli]